MTISYKLRLTRCIQQLETCRDQAVRNYRKQAGENAAKEIHCFYQDRINQLKGWMESERRGWELGDIEPCLREFEQLANPPKFER